MTAGWNFAELWETVADALPDAPAQFHLDRTWSWSQLDHRADALARWLVDAGASRQDKVALYLYNSPEYLETTFALFKASVRRALGIRRSWRQKVAPFVLLGVVTIPAIVNVGIGYVTRDQRDEAYARWQKAVERSFGWR